MEEKSIMNPLQRARAESLQIAGQVLANTKNILGGGKTFPAPIEGITDLLSVAEWIYGDPAADVTALDGFFPAKVLRGDGDSGMQVLEITPDKLPTLFEALSRMYPDCEHPDCPIHGPARAAKDLNPDDAKSEWEQHGSNPDREVDPRDLSGGWADSEDAKPDAAEEDTER